MYFFGLGGIPRGISRGVVISYYANNLVLLVESASPILSKHKSLVSSNAAKMIASEEDLKRFSNCGEIPDPYTLPEGLKVILGNKGESCSSSCEKVGAVCEVQWFVHLNFCPLPRSNGTSSIISSNGVLSREDWNKKCEKCSRELGYHYPSYNTQSKTCLTSSERHFNCYTSQPDAQRLCACKIPLINEA
jgi:hypothetical protein